MQKNNLLKTRDFEKYEIVIPYINVLGKRRSKFLYSELEKMHPCFSDEFAIDSAIKKITRRGLLEDIYVMNKLKLAEYERKRSLTGAGFFAEENELGRNPRLFVEKKWKLTLAGIIACLLLGATGCICGLLVGNSLTQDNAQKSAPVEISDKADEADSNQNPEPGESLSQVEEKIFSAAASSGGKISKLELFTLQKKEGLFQGLRASLRGVFPESLADYASDTVVYEKGIPFLEVDYQKSVGLSKGAWNSGSKANTAWALMDNPAFYASLRSSINKYGGEVKEEKTGPCHIDFTCSGSQVAETKSLLKDVNQIIAENQLCLSELSINQITGDLLQIGLSIENKNDLSAFWSAFDLALISENLDLFIESEEKRGGVKNHVRVASDFIESPAPPKEKIGEIKKSDKSSIIFYKNQDGKIERVIQNLMEEL